MSLQHNFYEKGALTELLFRIKECLYIETDPLLDCCQQDQLYSVNLPCGRSNCPGSSPVITTIVLAFGETKEMCIGEFIGNDKLAISCQFIYTVLVLRIAECSENITSMNYKRVFKKKEKKKDFIYCIKRQG